MPVRGNLRDMSLPSLISVNCNEMNDGCLVVRNGGEQASIYFERGNIVHIAMGSREGEDLLRELLSWEDGEFELSPNVAPPKHSIASPWSALLLKGMQQVDESTTEQDPAGGESGASAAELATRLRTVEGVSGVVVVAKDGIMLSAALDGQDPEKEGAMVAYIGGAAAQIGESLYFGAFQRAIVDMGSGQARLLVISQPDCYVGLLLMERASPMLVSDKAASIMQ